MGAGKTEGNGEWVTPSFMEVLFQTKIKYKTFFAWLQEE